MNAHGAAAGGDAVQAGNDRHVDRGHGAFVLDGTWDSTSSESMLVIDPLGKAYPGHLVTVIDPESGKELKSGEIGDIAIRRDSPVVMKEYWKNPEAMADKFRGEWMLTGDLGYKDDENYLFFEGRSDDVIKSAGYRIGPAEVEASIMEHKSVASCAVIGVPDDEFGESVLALISVTPGEADEPAMEREVIDLCREQLAHYKAPRHVKIVEEIPRSLAGKILKAQLRAPYWEGLDRRI